MHRGRVDVSACDGPAFVRVFFCGAGVSEDRRGLRATEDVPLRRLSALFKSAPGSRNVYKHETYTTPCCAALSDRARVRPIPVHNTRTPAPPPACRSKTFSAASTSPRCSSFSPSTRKARSRAPPSARRSRCRRRASVCSNSNRRSAPRCSSASARGMTLTPAGETLLHHARRVLRDIENIGIELADHASGVRGYVRMMANLSAIVEFLPEDLRAFQSAARARQARPRRAAERRRGRSASTTVSPISASVPATPTRATCTSTHYRHDSLVIVMRDDHPLARRETRRASPKRSTAITSACTPRVRSTCARISPRARRASRCACASMCRASTRCAGWCRPAWASACCRCKVYRTDGPPLGLVGRAARRRLGRAQPRARRARCRRAFAGEPPAVRPSAHGRSREKPSPPR